MSNPVATSTIAQQAFAELGLRPLSSYADAAPEAQAAKDTLVRARDMVLASYDWSCARVTIKPAQLTEQASMDALSPDPDLPYAFALPASTLALRHVAPPDARWRREGNVLRCDDAAPRVLLTQRIEREDALPMAVQYAISLQMAVLLAGRYAPTRTGRADLQAKLREALAVARQGDHVSASPDALDSFGNDLPGSFDWSRWVVR